jgi:hypothetical protein
MKSIFKKAFGVILIILGFLALITPFTPGSWLILIGFELLGFRILLHGKLRSLRCGPLGNKFRNLSRIGLRLFKRRPDSGPPRTNQRTG